MISQTKAYRTEDGKLFENELEAVEYELEKTLADLIRGLTVEDAVEAVINSAEKLMPLFQRVMQAPVTGSGPKHGSKDDPHRDKYADRDPHEQNWDGWGVKSFQRHGNCQ